MEPVPINDILSRQSRLQELLIESDIELALIRQTADLYYYSGVIVDGFLALGQMGEPLFWCGGPSTACRNMNFLFRWLFIGILKKSPPF